MVYVRKSGIFATVIVLASLVLGILVLLAGTSPTFLEQYDIFSWNMTGLKNNLTSQDPDSLGELPDFFRFHVQKTCYGNYSTTDGSRQNTTCKEVQAFQFLLDLTVDFSNQTGDQNADVWQTLNNTLNEIDKVGNSLNPGSSGSNVTFYIYCVAVAMIGLALIGAIAAMFTDGRLSATLNIIVDFLAFALMTVASGLSTFIAVAVERAINQYSDELGGSTADIGIPFLVVTWISAALMLVASIAWCVACGSRDRSERSNRGSYETGQHTTVFTTVFPRSKKADM